MRKRFALKKRLAQSPVYRGACVLLTFHFVAFTWVWIAVDSTRVAPALRYLEILLGF